MNRANPRSILLILMTMLSACGPRVQAQLAQSTEPRITSPSVSPEDVAALTAGNNAFALGLYQSVRTPSANSVFSPFSISLALAMTFAGARGQTEAQMADILHYLLPQDRLHPAFDQLDLDLQRQGQSTSKDQHPLQLDIANAIWGERTFSFLPAYLDLIAQNYGAGIQLADFVNQPEAVRQEINYWVSQQTQYKIKDLIAQGVLDPMTKLVLVNAIYFKADWAHQFEPSKTHDAPFHLLDGKQSQVKMMSGDLFGLPYVAGTGYQAFELAYDGGTAAMDVIVPDEGNFKQFEDSLDAPALPNILGGMQPTSATLGFPKFTFGSSFDLSSQLADLGMPDAFDPNLADFSGMTGRRDLFVSKVLHQALVAVDEKGTEAAAATTVIMSPTAILRAGVALTVDRPFLFLIRDLKTNQILFMGRVTNPGK